jgi:hypothetical protein
MELINGCKRKLYGTLGFILIDKAITIFPKRKKLNTVVRLLNINTGQEHGRSHVEHDITDRVEGRRLTVKISSPKSYEV